MPGTTLVLAAVLLLATIAGAAAQERPLSDDERAAIERRQNELVIERMRAAQRLDKPRALQCGQQPDMLVGLDRDALRARCGPWQSRRPTGPADIDELIYREPDGTLLLRVVAGEKVISAAAR